jgi:hypothetical protein
MLLIRFNEDPFYLTPPFYLTSLARHRSPHRVAVACAALCRCRSRRAAPLLRLTPSLLALCLHHARAVPPAPRLRLPHAAAPPPRSHRRARAVALPPSRRRASASLAPLRLHLALAGAPRLRLPRSTSCTSRSVLVADSSASFLKRDGRKT